MFPFLITAVLDFFGDNVELANVHNKAQMKSPQGAQKL